VCDNEKVIGRKMHPGLFLFVGLFVGPLLSAVCWGGRPVLVVLGCFSYRYINKYIRIRRKETKKKKLPPQTTTGSKQKNHPPTPPPAIIYQIITLSLI
jgi:hypothetical protein